MGRIRNGVVEGGRPKKNQNQRYFLRKRQTNFLA